MNCAIDKMIIKTNVLRELLRLILDHFNFNFKILDSPSCPHDTYLITSQNGIAECELTDDYIHVQSLATYILLLALHSAVAN